MLSTPHLIIIFIVVLVVFGPQKLPELARNLGKLMAEFRKASTDFRMAFEEEMRNLERQARDTEWKKSQTSLPPATDAEPAVLPVPEDSEAGSSREESILPVITPVAEAVPRSDERIVHEGPVESSGPDPDTSSSKNAVHDQQQPAG